MRKPVLLISFVVIVLACVFLVQTLRFPAADSQDIGAAFMPRVYCLALIILGIVLMVQEWRKAPEVNQGSIKMALGAMAGTVIYIYLITVIGFYVITPVMGFLFLWVMKVRRPFVLLGIPLGISVFIYTVFGKILHIPLPEGSLFI